MSSGKQNDTLTYIPSRWLTMIPGSGECQICTQPEGNTRTYYLNIRCNGDDKFGFLVCGKDECNKFIKSYISKIYSDIYNTKAWRRILNIYANNLFITVKRSNGIIENDWILDNEWDYDSNKVPLNISFLYAILCNNKKNENNENYIYPVLPNEIWEYIYNMCLQSYTDNINLTVTRYDKTNNIVEPCIRVKKGDIYKKVLMDSIF